MKKFSNINCVTENYLAIVTVDRPSKLNALNKETIKELHACLQQLENDSSIKVVLLTGAGNKAFVAGADIAEFAGFSVKKGTKLAAQGQELLFDFIENFDKPVIAAINGYALGGGLELAMACHFRVASHNAKLGLPEVSLGVIPGYGGTQRLPQLVGKGRAMEMIMTGGMIEAEKAQEYGLVNHVVALEELMPVCKKIISSISKNSPVALKYAIKAINTGFMHDEDGFATEIRHFGSCFGTQDFIEGTTAFLEKRKANFPGK